MKNNNVFGILFIILLLMAFNSAEGQQNNLPRISDVTESINIDTDRDLYFCGEDILFTAEYFINNEKITPQLSNILYVELIDCSDDAPIIQKKIRISDFNANGVFNIPKDIATGNYMIRAYTQYQRNFSSLDYVYHFVRILNPNNNSLPIANSQEFDSIHFVPEGNILIENIKNKLVIRVPNFLIDEGNKYYITDEQFNIIKIVDPLYMGLVQIEMAFNESKRYQLLLIKNNGDSIVKKIPRIQKTGIQTNTVLKENFVKYTIQSRGLIKNNHNLNYQIKVFSSDYSVKYKKDVSLIDSTFNIDIPSDILGYGINYIVLTDSNGNVEKANSIFNAKPSNEISIETDKSIYIPHDNIQAKLLVNNSNADSLQNVSVSVTLHGTKKEDIDFISSQYLKHPLLLQDYLSSLPEQNNKLQNQIMILFDEVLNKELFIKNLNTKIATLEYVPEILDHTISGILRDKKTKEPVANQDIYVSVLSGNPQFHINKTKVNGEFILPLNSLYGINNVFLCSPTLIDDEQEILVKNSFANGIPSIGARPITLDLSEKKLIEQIYFNSQIQRRFSKNSKSKINKTTQTPGFNIDGSKITIDLDEYIKLEGLNELFNELIPNIRIKKTKGQYSFNVVNNSGYELPGNPLILLDKIPILNPNQIMQLDISKFKKVEVLYKTYILGSHTINGVVMITSNTDNFAGTKFSGSSKFIKFQSLEEPFDYSTLNNSHSNSSTKVPDFKTTLYWNPKIIFLTNDQVININATDSKGVYDIVVKGYTAKGNYFIGRKQITIN